MPVLCVGSTKGGVGKSTLSVNIAAAATEQGANVLLLDTDAKQRSSMAWRALRKQDDITAVGITTATVHRDVPKLRDNYDLIIIDAGGRDDEMLRSSILACDILLIPVAPSAFDVYAAEDTVKILAEANSMRQVDVEAYLLVNQFKENSRIGKKTLSALESYSEIAPVLNTVIHDYSAYKNCLDTGEGVATLIGAGKAAGEIDYLVYRLGLLQQKDS